MSKVIVDPEQTAVFIMEMLMAEGVKFPGPWEDIALKISDEIARSHDPDIAGLELTEQICFDKLKKERDAYREALAEISEMGCYMGGEDDIGLDKAIKLADRILLSQSSEGE